MITQYGQLNTTALSNPDIYVQIVPPQIMLLNGVPTNIGGVVGTASWGPVNSPVRFADVNQGSQVFGPQNARKYDLMTAVAVSCLQGKAGNYVGVRVTDGSDTAATGSAGDNGNSTLWTAIANAVNTGSGVMRGPSNLIVATPQTNGISVTAKYTGSLGAKIKVGIATGSKIGSYRVVVTMPGAAPEIFDNIGSLQTLAAGSVTFVGQPTANQTLTIGGTTVTFVASGATGNQVNIGANIATTLASLLAFLAASVDSNLSKCAYALSGLVLSITAKTAGAAGNSIALTTTVTGATASSGTLTGAVNPPTLTSYSLSGGADGATAINGLTMLGQDIVPRTGMYALRKTGCSVGMLADMDDVTTVATQDAFGLQEGIFMVYGGPSGQAPADAVLAKQLAGVDTYAIKWMLGDWITFNDSVNGVQRKVSPASWAFGRYVNLAPHMSGLNKAILGLVSTEKSAANQVYSDSDISQLWTAGIDVICNPVPGGNYFGLRTGRNASSNPATRNDTYTRMTNYIASTANAGMGKFVGELQSRRANDNTRRRAKVTLDAFFSAMANVQPDPMIDDFQVILDKSINTDQSIAAGNMIAYCKVVYMAVVEFFIVNIEGGQTVEIQRQGVFSSSDRTSSAYQYLNTPLITGAAA